MLGLPTFVCAAVAVGNLNANATNLRDVEQSRDNTVTAAGMLVGVALVSMLIEGVMTAMCFCTKGGVIAFVVSYTEYVCTNSLISTVTRSLASLFHHFI